MCVCVCILMTIHSMDRKDLNDCSKIPLYCNKSPLLTQVTRSSAKRFLYMKLTFKIYKFYISTIVHCVFDAIIYSVSFQHVLLTLVFVYEENVINSFKNLYRRAFEGRLISKSLKRLPSKVPLEESTTGPVK